MNDSKAILNGSIQRWFDETFAAQQGNTVRRRRDIVECSAWVHVGEYPEEELVEGLEAVVIAARERQWHVVENGDQVIVFCNGDGLVIHC